MTTHNPYQDAQRANDAKELVAHPLLVEAFDQLEKSYLSAWRESDPMAQDERERLWLAIQVLEHVKGNLRVIIENGAVAKREIDRLAGRR
jgi:hypothetical protein